jgi:hypothetical protein
MTHSDLKTKLVKKILQTEDKSLLDRIFKLLNISDGEESPELTQDQRAELELGIKQISGGETIALEDFMAKFS